MQYKHDYLVPDYYPSYVCKGPDCRSTCCKNWKITLTMEEYFSLLGLNCTSELRQTLDCAMRLSDEPTPERYAVFSPNWEGDCRIHRADGWCALQKECGEEVLTSVCRYYPRSPRHAHTPECSCSCSCEKTLELLFSHQEPLTFHRIPLTFRLSEEETVIPISQYAEMRSACISLLQDRSRSIPDRIRALSAYLLPEIDCRAADSDALLGHALRTVLLLLTRLGHNSHNLNEHLPSLYDAMQITDPNDGACITESVITRYRSSRRRLPTLLPDCDIKFEQVLVNHIFYDEFPFSDCVNRYLTDINSLVCVYAVLQFLSVCKCASRQENLPIPMSEWVDLYAAAFRLIDHTAFGINADKILSAANEPIGNLLLL